jgi:hypothetical protein
MEFTPDNQPAPAPTPFNYRNRFWNPDSRQWEYGSAEPRTKPYVEITPTEKPPTFTPDKPADPLASAPRFVRDLPSPVPGVSLGAAIDMPGEYARINREAREQMGRGVESLMTPNERVKGAFETAIGGMRFMGSPVEAAVHSVVGKPLTEATGSERAGQYADFAAGLAVPFYGLSGAASQTPVLRQAQKIFSPSIMSPEAERAAGLIRSEGGKAARDTAGIEQALQGERAPFGQRLRVAGSELAQGNVRAATDAFFDSFSRQINQLPDPAKLDVMHYMEGQPGAFIRPDLKPMADTMRDAFELRRTKLEKLYPTLDFVEDYFPHFWQDPQAAKNFVQQWSGGAAKQGSGASLKKRSIPTIADGIAAGLKPLTTDPIEATMRYVQSMDRFIAAQEVLGAGRAAGDVRYFRPKTIGASGHPDSFQGVPDGWVPIQGRGATDATGAKAYAPADWARVYNNFIDPGWHRSEAWGPVLDTAQRASNAITALELGLSGYHAFTMANEGIINGVARGVSELAGGKIRGVGSIAQAPLAPVLLAHRGKKLQDIYLGRSTGNADWRRITDLLTQAGGRASGIKHSPDYSFSAMDNYWTAWRRGALKQDMAQSWQNIKDRPVVGPVKEAGKLIGRTMSTVAYPLFQKYIPLIKNGAFYDTMNSRLKMHPGATHEQQVAMARKIWDSIDNRFGEMVQDNIFWNKTMKQAATLGMRSYSWNLGTVREIGGGALSAIKDPRRLSMSRADYDPRVAYVVALPIVVATMNAVYQKLITGKNPEDVTDLLAGRTGGEAPGFGGRGTVPERVMLPGYQKDVLGWYEDAVQEAQNKIARGPMMAWQLGVTGKDWRGDPIANMDAPLPERLSQYFAYVADSLTPISLKTALQERKEGSRIGPMGRLVGERPAPAYLQDPEGYERGMGALRRRAWKGRERHERKQQMQYGGTQE